MSGVLGFTSGILLATIAFEMLPSALEHSSLVLATLGFAAGFVAVYAFDLFIQKGILVGKKAEQRRWLKRTYRSNLSHDGLSSAFLSRWRSR